MFSAIHVAKTDMATQFIDYATDTYYSGQDPRDLKYKDWFSIINDHDVLGDIDIHKTLGVRSYNVKNILFKDESMIVKTNGKPNWEIDGLGVTSSKTANLPEAEYLVEYLASDLGINLSELKFKSILNWVMDEDYPDDPAFGDSPQLQHFGVKEYDRKTVEFNDGSQIKFLGKGNPDWSIQ